MVAMTRRAALAGFAAALSGGAGALAQVGSSFERRPGMQLWTVGAQMKRNPAATLRRVRQIGYERVETAGYAGRTPAKFSAMVRQAGLTCDSVHHSAVDLFKDLDKCVGAARDMGAKWLVCSSPAPIQPLVVPKGGSWLRAISAAMGPEDWKRNYEMFARAGERAHAAGLVFAYHNHRSEFEGPEGQRPIDHILRLDPQRVRLELDIGWAAAARIDPAAFLRSHPGRVDLLHVKDMKPLPPGDGEPQSTEIGRGIVNWPSVFEAARATGVKSWFIEQEAPFVRPVYESLAMSLAYVSKL
jgi:sugar phosphate isomerase/epimerase